MAGAKGGLSLGRVNDIPSRVKSATFETRQQGQTGLSRGGLALVYLVYTNLEQSLSRESKQFWASPKCLVVQKMICPIGLETAMIGFGSLTRRCCNRKERSGYVSALEVFIT